MTPHTAPPGRFLACVEYRKHDVSSAFARLRPTNQIESEGWRPIAANDSRFLDDGLIFWWDPPKHALEGTLWVVTLQPQLQYGKDHKHRDRVQVDEAVRPYQAISIHGAKGPGTFRRALASGRFAFEGRLVGQPLVRVVGEPGLWIPLPDGLSATVDRALTRIMLPSPQGMFAVQDINASRFQRLLLDGQHYSLLAELDAPYGYRCALSDAQLLEHIRKRVSKLDGRVLTALGVTKNLVRTYAETIEAAGLGGDEAVRESAREDAVQTLVAGLEAELDVARALADELLTHPQLTDSSEITKAGTTGAPPRSDHEERIKALQAELDAERQEVASLRERLANQNGDRLPDLDADRAPVSMKPPAGPIPVLVTGKELKDAVAAWCELAGLDLYTIQVALAAVLAHPITLFHGARAEAMAEALALSVAGDRAVRVSVGSAVFGSSDVLCAPVAALGSTEFEQQPCSLGQFLMAHDDTPAIVVLSGCNLAPVQLTLSDFLPALDGHARRVAWSGRDGLGGSFELPPRVRFIGTLLGGPDTHLIPEEFGNRLPLVPADHVEFPDIPLNYEDSPSPTRMSAELDTFLRQISKDPAIDELAKWIHDRVPGLSKPVAARMFSTYVNLLEDLPRALAAAFSALLAGRPWELVLDDLPSAFAQSISDRVSESNERPAWRAGARHFHLGEEL